MPSTMTKNGKAGDFFAAARSRYVAANAGTLDWMLSRRALHGAFVNTKVNSITLEDYGAQDGWRGPDYLYGWIQGRALEAITTHAHFFGPVNRDLARRLDEAGRVLYPRLAELFQRHGQHGYFCYDKNLNPIVRGRSGEATRQSPARELFTYSDAFFVKGLIAGAARYDDKSLDIYLARLRDVVDSIGDGRFVGDEQRPFDHGRDERRALEFGPWMILMGAAGLLHRLGLHAEATFGTSFIERVLKVNWDGHSNAASDLVPDEPTTERANPGHAIEFVGFAHEFLPVETDPSTLTNLRRMLVAAFDHGFRDKGIALSISVEDGRPLSDYRPWWSLPETVRAAALALERDPQDDRLLDIWRKADKAFFENYWRGQPAIAYQTRDKNGPVDFVPATPDLDPGYHTGLSLLAAIQVIDRMDGR